MLLTSKGLVGMLSCNTSTLFLCDTLELIKQKYKEGSLDTLVNIHIFRNNDREITIYFTGLAAKFCETLFIWLVYQIYHLSNLRQLVLLRDNMQCNGRRDLYDCLELTGARFIIISPKIWVDFKANIKLSGSNWTKLFAMFRNETWNHGLDDISSKLHIFVSI